MALKKKCLVLRRAWKLIALSFMPIIRVRKLPADDKLFFKSRRRKLLRRCNYAFLKEYEFSPASTPPFQHLRSHLFKNWSCIFSLVSCGYNSTFANRFIEEKEEMLGCGDANKDFEVLSIAFSDREFEMEEEDDEENDDEGDESVDGRADRFIEKFYEDMRIQRRESISRYRDMLCNSCI